MVENGILGVMIVILIAVSSVFYHFSDSIDTKQIYDILSVIVSFNFPLSVLIAFGGLYALYNKYKGGEFKIFIDNMIPLLLIFVLSLMTSVVTFINMEYVKQNIDSKDVGTIGNMQKKMLTSMFLSFMTYLVLFVSLYLYRVNDKNKKLNINNEQGNNFETRLGDVEEKLDGFKPKLDGFKPKLDGFNIRLDDVKENLDGVIPKLDGFNKRLDDVEENLGDVNNRLYNIEKNIPTPMIQGGKINKYLNNYKKMF
jgi:hypothetical protein